MAWCPFEISRSMWFDSRSARARHGEILRLRDSLYELLKVLPLAAQGIHVVEQGMQKAAVQIHLVARAPKNGEYVEGSRPVRPMAFVEPRRRPK